MAQGFAARVQEAWLGRGPIACLLWPLSLVYALAWRVREAAWRAGWPYPVADARAWSVGDGLTPPRDLLTWVEQIPADEPMSLVRARGRDSDEWVGVAGRPPVELGALPRIANLGSPLLIPAVPGGIWRAADPSGALSEGSLSGLKHTHGAAGRRHQTERTAPASTTASRRAAGGRRRITRRSRRGCGPSWRRLPVSPRVGTRA